MAGDRDRRSARMTRIASVNYRLYLVIRHSGLVGLLVHVGMVPMFLLLGVPSLALLNVFSVAAWLFARWRNERGDHGTAIVVLTVEVVVHAVLATLTLGWHAGFAHYLVTLITFVMFNYRLSDRLVVLQSVLIVLIYAGLFAGTQGGGWQQLPASQLAWLQFGNMLASFFTLALISYYFRSASIHSVQVMQELAHTDQLTRLPNRHHLWERLEGERLRSQHRDSLFVIVMADIDRFKAINDQHGHAIGDRVLCHVSELLAASLREQDTVGRWGGEEFLVILPGMTLADGMRAAERIREAVAKSVLLSSGQGLAVTLSCGVTDCRPGDDLDHCLRRADEALYRAKAEGRNRVMAASPAAS